MLKIYFFLECTIFEILIITANDFDKGQVYFIFKENPILKENPQLRLLF